MHGIFFYTRQSTLSEYTIFLSFIILLVAGIEYVPPSKHLLNVLGMLQGMDCVHCVSSWQVHSALHESSEVVYGKKQVFYSPRVYKFQVT